MQTLLFSSPSCAPCKAAKTALNDAEIDYKVVDIEDNWELCTEYGVRTVPTLIIVDDQGEAVLTCNGGVSKIISSIKKTLNGY